MGPPGRLRLGSYLRVSLVMVGAPLGMAHDNGASPGVREHLGGNVTRMRT